MNFLLTKTPATLLNARSVSTQGELLSVYWFVETSPSILAAIANALDVPLGPEAQSEMATESTRVVHSALPLNVGDGVVVGHATPADPIWDQWLESISSVSRAVGSVAHITMSDGVYVLGMYSPQLDIWLVRESFHYTLDTEPDSVGFFRR